MILFGNASFSYRTIYTLYKTVYRTCPEMSMLAQVRFVFVAPKLVAFENLGSCRVFIFVIRHRFQDVPVLTASTSVVSGRDNQIATMDHVYPIPRWCGCSSCRCIYYLSHRLLYLLIRFRYHNNQHHCRDFPPNSRTNNNHHHPTTFMSSDDLAR